ncbi:penicillin-binding protein 1A [Nonlabens marinus]|uniref:Monofunctional biosynthetic peptidoglycan transglycosylase n=1 Tax=Nonlabens marinus S1-08 TaxID=1454201 RepID=W8VPF3_9FLAO|nr:transglycosylase domain-containing protein [Nonlabens marinus]BAO55019.1 monofunctional biosynthetic peptidoglycan transglycosylase [Nonlabens marinus S1-08]
MAVSKAEAKRKEDLRGNVILFWKLVALGVGLVALVLILTSWGVFGALPDHTKLENPDTDLATEIVTADGETLGKFYKDNRTPVAYEDLPQNMVDALVSTEDERFFEHSGIDGYGTLRAVAYLGSRGGASTITQQLAKNYFTDQPSSNILERIGQKLKEWIISIRLERQYTKEEIIAQYLNQIDFLYNADGVRSASRIYFGKEPKNLNVEESAVIVAMLKNPRQYNPRREISKEKSLQRRNQVFVQMVRNDKMTETVKDSLRAQPIELDYNPEGHNDGMATYFREYLRSWLDNWIEENPNPEDGEKYNIYRDGLKVNVTIDSRMQNIAERAVTSHMKNLQAEFDKQNRNLKTAPFRDVTEEEVNEKILGTAMRRSERWRLMKAQGKSDAEIKKSFLEKTDMTIFSWNGNVDTVMTPIDSIRYYKKFLQAGMMSMEPQTGHVKAWVGGINHEHFKYDHVKKGKRQPGSTFKPFLYATAIDLLRYSPCRVYSDGEYTIPAGRYGNMKDWSPKNSSGGYGNMRTLKDGLANSVNTISARLMDEVGPQAVLDRVKTLGIDTSNMSAQPALALGTEDVSLYEMVAAYGVFANGGIYNEPVLVTSIEDKNGTVLYQYVPESKDVLNPEVAYVTVKLMEGVTQIGSGARLKDTWRVNQSYANILTDYPYGISKEQDIAGKTGTTQNQSDGWFMGMVPNLVTGVWVGGEDRSVHFPTITYGQGASMALPIWGSFMKGVYKDESIGISKEPFPRPTDLSIQVDCAVYDMENGTNGEDSGDDSDELDM